MMAENEEASSSSTDTAIVPSATAMARLQGEFRMQTIRDELGIGKAELEMRENAGDTYTVERNGLQTISLGHGRTKLAVPSAKGDKLGMAAQRGDITNVARLLKKGVNPNAQNAASGVTPLGVAAERAHLEVIQVLLKYKADPSICTKDNINSLHIAAQFGQAEVTKLLVSEEQLSRGLDLNLPGGLNGGTPLMMALARNSMETMRVLLDARADVNALAPQSSAGSALHLACRLGNVDALKLLLDEPNCNPILRNAFNETPLETAITSGAHVRYIECAALLRPLCKALGAPVALTDKDPQYIRIAMSVIAGHMEKDLLTPGSGCKFGGEAGREQVPLSTELIAAHVRMSATMGDVQAVKNFTLDPSVVNAPDVRGRAALHLACMEGHLGVAASLLQRQAAVNAEDTDGRTPLHLACVADHFLIAKLLVKHGADLEALDGCCERPYDIAGTMSKPIVKPAEAAPLEITDASAPPASPPTSPPSSPPPSPPSSPPPSPAPLSPPSSSPSSRAPSSRAPPAERRPQVLLIRHGEGTHNLRSCGGSTDPYQTLDPRLTDKGRRQAAELRGVAALHDAQLVVVSPLSRAIETAAIAFGGGGGASMDRAPPTAGQRFCLCPLHSERWSNLCDQGRPKSELAHDFPFIREWEHFDALDELWTPTEETDRDWEARRLPAFVAWLRARPEAKIAVIGHGAYFQRLVGRHLHNCEVEEMSWDAVRPTVYR